MLFLCKIATILIPHFVVGPFLGQRLYFASADNFYYKFHYTITARNIWLFKLHSA